MNNCWCGRQNRTDLRKCIHQHDGKQRNNNTRALWTNIVCFECKKIDNKRSILFFTSFFFCCLSVFLHRKKTIFVESALVLLFPSLYPFYNVGEKKSCGQKERNGRLNTAGGREHKIYLDETNIERTFFNFFDKCGYKMTAIESFFVCFLNNLHWNILGLFLTQNKC